jgi:hypothetical protein
LYWWSFLIYEYEKEMIEIAIKLATSITYTATGSQSNFAIPFDYLRPAFVYVAVNGEDISEGFTVSNRMVMFDAAPVKDAIVRIYRNTPTKRLVSWADASILKAKDMTIAEVQQLHLIEEGQDWYKTKSMTLDEDDEAWEGRNYPIQHLADPRKDQDAVTKHFMENDFMNVFVLPNIKKAFSDSNVSTAAMDAKKYMEMARDYAEMVKDQALTCARWQIGNVRKRDPSKPTYGLDGNDLIINVPDVIKLTILGDSNV